MTCHPLSPEIRTEKNCPGPADSEPAARDDTFPSRRSAAAWSLHISDQDAEGIQVPGAGGDAQRHPRLPEKIRSDPKGIAAPFTQVDIISCVPGWHPLRGA